MLVNDRPQGSTCRKRQRQNASQIISYCKPNACIVTNCHISNNTGIRSPSRNKMRSSNRSNVLALALTLLLTTFTSYCHAKEDKDNTNGNRGAGLVDPAQAHWNHAAAKARYVVHVVADGLRPDHMLDYPNFAYLKRHGVGTGNARNQFESPQTLPNHISMFTGLSVSQHGHFEDGDGKAKLTSFANIFDLVKAVGGTTAFYGAKEKFNTFVENKWQIDNYVFTKWAHRVMNNWMDDMTANPYTYSFVHFREADRAGHLSTGANSTQYSDAVQQMDEYIGQMFDYIRTNPALNGNTAIILTSDHGFEEVGNHNDLDDPLVFKVPFYVYGPAVLQNKDIYELNNLKDPGNERITPSCISNAYSGVMAASLLGISYAEGPFAKQYLSVTGAKDSSAAASLSNQAAINQAPIEILPPSGVGGTPANDPDNCVHCPNEPNDDMRLKGRTCEAWRLVPQKCLSPSNQWIAEQTCKRSCYFHGNPYDSTICCRNAEPAIVPTLRPPADPQPVISESAPPANPQPPIPAGPEPVISQPIPPANPEPAIVPKPVADVPMPVENAPVADPNQSTPLPIDTPIEISQILAEQAAAAF